MARKVSAALGRTPEPRQTPEIILLQDHQDPNLIPRSARSQSLAHLVWVLIQIPANQRAAGRLETWETRTWRNENQRNLREGCRSLRRGASAKISAKPPCGPSRKPLTSDVLAERFQSAGRPDRVAWARIARGCRYNSSEITGKLRCARTWSSIKISSSSSFISVESITIASSAGFSGESARFRSRSSRSRNSRATAART